MSPAPDVTKLAPGTVLVGKYRVVRTLGVGGMGVVVACEHLTLGTRVALKFLLPQFLANPGIAKRFVREAQAAIRINSEHVARVMDVDLLPDGLPFMVMEYLQGKDLAVLVDAGRRFGIEESIDYVAQAAEALAQAHHVGVVHRDVKPANIFLVHRGDDLPLVKVLDFGISKMLDEPDTTAFQRGLTKTTTVLGSGLYMSPEQMRSAKTVDHRTDIYALGIVLYELLAHTQPYTAESFAELAVRVNTEPPDPLTRHREDVPEELADAIARAYARHPEDRYGSVVDFVAALAPFASPATLPLIESIRRIGAGRELAVASPLSTTGPDRDGGEGAPKSFPPRSPTTGSGERKSFPPRSPTTGSGEHKSFPPHPPTTDGHEASLARAGTAMASTATTRLGTTGATSRSVARRLAPWIVLGLAAAGGAVAASYLLGDPLLHLGRAPAAGSTGTESAVDPNPSEVGPDAATADTAAPSAGGGGSTAATGAGGVGGSDPDAGATRRIPTVTITSEKTQPSTNPAATAPPPTKPPTTAPPATTTPPPPPTATPPPTAPAGPCFRKDPETGMQQMVPCE